MKHAHTRSKGAHSSGARGFSLIELIVAATILVIVTGASVSYIAIAIQRSRAEQTAVDLSQEGREFVDEFERDIHQSGYPGCANFNNAGINNCATSATFNNANFAAGLVYVSSTQIIFEGDVDGDGIVDSVQYRLVDSDGNYPPSSTCPCTIQRSQVPKVAGLSWPPTPYQQATNWSQMLQNVANSGVPATGATYGGGLPLAGNVLHGGMSNTAYYASVVTFKDFPVFSFYDQNGGWPQVSGVYIPLPLDNSTTANQQALAQIKSIRLTINLLASATSGYDLKTGIRPIATLVGNGRRNNRMPWEQ